MKQNLFDLSTDMLIETISDIRAEVRDMFQGTAPYRKEPIPPKERLLNYLDYLQNPEIEQALLGQGVEPDRISAYHTEMQKLMRRYENA